MLAPLLLTTLLVLQAPARDTVREATGTAALAGTVVSEGGARAPLRDVRVTLRGATLAGPRLTATDARGRFSFVGLPPGTYTLQAQKPAYVTMNYGATRPERDGTPVSLTDGQQIADLTINVPRGAVIAGRVMDERGEPAAGLAIEWMSSRAVNGIRSLVSSGQAAATNDRGEYRLFNLEAGDYLVVVSPDDPRGPAEIVELTDADVDRALQQTGAMNTPTLGTQRPRVVGAAPIFYPGTADAANATVIHLAAGEERDGADIRLQRVPVARIEGTVTTPDGRPASGTRVMLMPQGAPATDVTFAPGGRLGPRTLDTTGTFAFVGVPPGEYSLTAGNIVGLGGPFAAAPPPETRVAYAAFVVNGEDQHVDLLLREGISIAGRLAFDDAPPASFAGARLTIDDLHVFQPGYARSFSAEVEADGTFHLGGLVPGQYALRMTPPGGADSPWSLSSFMANGRELLDAPFELAMNVNLSDAVASFTAKPAGVTGVLQNASGLPASEVFIVVFAADRAFWFPNSRRIAAVRPDTAGTYIARNLPPGDYYVAALTDVDPGEWFDSSFLEGLAAQHPVRLTVRPHEMLKQDLRLGP